MVVEDMSKDRAFDDAVKGRISLYIISPVDTDTKYLDISGLVHCASVTHFSPIPEEVIDPVINGTL